MRERMVRSAVACVVCALPVFFSAPVPAQDSLPASFKIGPQGNLTCVGTTEDTCAFYDEIPDPGGTLYLVQGSFSRALRPDGDFVNFYFALLCEREGDVLKPVFNFLEGRERASDVHLHDLDGDGRPEIIVAGVFGSRASYAAVYRVVDRKPVRIFSRRANSPDADFEVVDGVPSLVFVQRSGGTGASSRALREVFVWNGKEFVPES